MLHLHGYRSQIRPNNAQEMQWLQAANVQLAYQNAADFQICFFFYTITTKFVVTYLLNLNNQ